MYELGVVQVGSMRTGMEYTYVRHDQPFVILQNICCKKCVVPSGEHMITLYMEQIHLKYYSVALCALSIAIVL